MPDDSLVVSAFWRAIRYQVVGTAADGAAAVRRVKATSPDVLVLDLNLPGVHGFEVCEQLATEALPTKILILSVSGERQDVLNGVKAGASGYLVKSAAREELLEAVRRTARGRAVFTPRAGRVGARRVPADAERRQRRSDCAAAD